MANDKVIRARLRIVIKTLHGYLIIDDHNVKGEGDT
jgi:hypothetical protein